MCSLHLAPGSASQSLGTGPCSCPTETPPTSNFSSWSGLPTSLTGTCWEECWASSYSILFPSCSPFKGVWTHSSLKAPQKPIHSHFILHRQVLLIHIIPSTLLLQGPEWTQIGMGDAAGERERTRSWSDFSAKLQSFQFENSPLGNDESSEILKQRSDIILFGFRQFLTAARAVSFGRTAGTRQESIKPSEPKREVRKLQIRILSIWIKRR